MTSGICILLKHIKLFTITICSTQNTSQEYAIMDPSKGALPNPETHQNETCGLLPLSSIFTQYLRDIFRSMLHELPGQFWILLVYASLFTLILHVGKNCLSESHSNLRYWRYRVHLILECLGLQMSVCLSELRIKLLSRGGLG